MNSRSALYFGLALISLIIALVIFFWWLDIKALLFGVFAVATVFLFRQGIVENKKKQT